MKHKFFIFLGLSILIIVLIGLNAVSFSQKEKQPDTEFSPNRSTFNVGTTGTRAFYDLLAETGRRPVRWQEPPAALLSAGLDGPSTFVMIGALRIPVGDEEAAQLLKWTADGGRLVIIDREPPENLVKTTANWNIKFNSDLRRPFYSTDASDQQRMTAGITAARPAQPTLYNRGVNGVQPSVFAASVNFEYFGGAPVRQTPPPAATPPRERAGDSEIKAKPAVVRDPHLEAAEAAEPVETVALEAPVVHLATDGRNLLVDVPYGSGKIIFLSDPYIVANGGINLVDNAQLAINLVALDGGVIAFDEYHQGYGSNQNRLFQYFAGTPVVAIIVQIVLIIGLLFFSQSRRFARPLPENEPNRLSKLEYVSAMASLQQRTKAFDLAIENIYTDFRRRVSRLVGVDNFTTRPADLARLVAERLPGENPAELEALMRQCEDVMHGERTNQKTVLRLTTRLRELEEKLGLQRKKARGGAGRG